MDEMIGLGSGLSQLIVGEVVNYNTITRELEVLIPRLFPFLPTSRKLERLDRTNQNSRLKVSGTEYSQNVRLINFVTAKALNINEPLPDIGSKVLITFLDDNIDLIYWSRFIVSDEYSVIDSEKFPEIYTLNFSIRGEDTSSSFEVNTLDTVHFEFPEGTHIHYEQEDDKIKKVKIYSNENYIISKEQPERKFEGLMWFNPENGKLSIFSKGVFRNVKIGSD